VPLPELVQGRGELRASGLLRLFTQKPLLDMFRWFRVGGEAACGQKLGGLGSTQMQLLNRVSEEQNEGSYEHQSRV
jgi:hypothetical protein